MKINNIEMTYQGRGDQLLGICKGTNEDLNRHEMSLYNHGAYNGEPQWIHDEMFEFWTSKDKMEKYFKNRIHHVVRDNVSKPKKSARLAARQKFVYLGYRVAGLPNRQVKQLAHAIRPEAKACAIAARQFAAFLRDTVVGQRKFSKTGEFQDEGMELGRTFSGRPDEDELNELGSYAVATTGEVSVAIPQNEDLTDWYSAAKL